MIPASVMCVCVNLLTAVVRSGIPALVVILDLDLFDLLYSRSSLPTRSDSCHLFLRLRLIFVRDQCSDL